PGRSAATIATMFQPPPQPTPDRPALTELRKRHQGDFARSVPARATARLRGAAPDRSPICPVHRSSPHVPQNPSASAPSSPSRAAPEPLSDPEPEPQLAATATTIHPPCRLAAEFEL